MEGSKYVGNHEILCVIWYLFYNLKNVKNNHGEVLLLVKLYAVGYFFEFGLAIYSHIRLINPIKHLWWRFLLEIVAVNYFCKKAPSEIFDRVLSRPLGRILEYNDQIKSCFLVQFTKWICLIWDHSFRMYANFMKNISYTLIHARMCVH